MLLAYEIFTTETQAQYRLILGVNTTSALLFGLAPFFTYQFLRFQFEFVWLVGRNVNVLKKQLINPKGEDALNIIIEIIDQKMAHCCLLMH